MYDPSGQIRDNLNIFDLLGYQLGVQHKIATKNYQALFKLKESLKLRFFHKDLIGQSRDEKMAEVIFELKQNYHDLYFIKEHLKGNSIHIKYILII